MVENVLQLVVQAVWRMRSLLLDVFSCYTYMETEEE